MNKRNLTAQVDFTFIDTSPREVQFFFGEVARLIKDMQTENTLLANQVKMETTFSVEDVYEVSNRV